MFFLIRCGGGHVPPAPLDSHLSKAKKTNMQPLVLILTHAFLQISENVGGILIKVSDNPGLDIRGLLYCGIYCTAPNF